MHSTIISTNYQAHIKLRKLISDIKLALLGALAMGCIIFYINIDAGWAMASVAALKQFSYSLFLGAIIIKILEIIVCAIKHTVISILISVSITAILTICLVYFVHSLRGTPKPFESTLPTICLAPFGLFFVAAKKRFGMKST